MLLIISTLIVGCDRQTLDGLNLKINAEVNSEYDKDKNLSEEENQTQVTEKEEISSEEKTSTSESDKELTTEIVNNKQEKEEEKITENDPDQPMAFKEINECSKAGITSKTNEIFYADNPQVKSIDSKNEKQVKAWKKIYNEVEKNCNN
ncbi:hypothetical protein GM3708_994 [Geminocystis sp. NIES-3708]|nr:hypothetical protein GM3708_994 [Geminocystis sp. NIES-3708]